MRRVLLVALALFAVSLPGCIIIDDGDLAGGFDFNGEWVLAMTGCQAQTGNVVIRQSGSSIAMRTNALEWTGTCDPRLGTFTVTASGGWGSWTFQGSATSADTMRGSYLYVEYRRGECTGTFDASRVAFNAAAGTSRPIERLP